MGTLGYVFYWLYVIFWETLCWGGVFYLILERGWSAWWIIFAFVLSYSVMRPQYKRE